MKNAALICDVTSLFNAASQKHEGITLAYVGFDAWLKKELDIDVLYKGLYIRNQKPRQAINFITLAKSEGYEVMCDKRDWNPHMAFKLFDLLPSYEAFVLATDDPKHLQYGKWLKSRGKLVYHACFLPAKFYQESSTKVIAITHTRERPKRAPANTAESVVVPADSIRDADRITPLVSNTEDRARRLDDSDARAADPF